MQLKKKVQAIQNAISEQLAGQYEQRTFIREYQEADFEEGLPYPEEMQQLLDEGYPEDKLLLINVIYVPGWERVEDQK